MLELHSKKSQPKIIAKLREASRQFPHYLRTMRLIWSATPRLTLAWALLLLLQGLLPAASVYLTKPLVDSLVAVIGSGFDWATLQPLAIIAAMMAGILLLGELSQGFLEWVRSAQSEYIRDYVAALIHEKSASVDLAFYESPEYYDHLHRAQSEASTRSLALLESTGGLIQNAITLLAMAGVLIPYGAWLPVLLIVGTFPALAIVFRYNYRYNQWWKRTTSDRRWTQYYDMLLTYGHVAAELRLFDLGPHFRSAYQGLRQRLRKERLELVKEQSLVRLGAGGFALVTSGVAVLWVVWRVAQGLFSLGDLALFYQAFNRGQGLMRALFANLGQIYANSLFLSNLYEFLELEPQVTDPIDPVPPPSRLSEGIQLQDVTFRYPCSQRLVLDGFELNFPAGHITAIVGPNGAGKSTLVKLLCRFYDPEGGGIRLDGTDIRDYAISDLRRLITVLFQIPVPYYTTAAQNIAMGDLSDGRNLVAIEKAARGAGAHEIIARLPQGYQTLLGKLFAGGAELSVGEWQRVALARAFLRQAQIIILDEPTSFMDSWAETDWMARFRQLVAGRTAIIITHRFTTARHADIIHVMSHGKIIESGSHKELLALGGMYAHSWRAQTESIPLQPEPICPPRVSLSGDGDGPSF
jgi:ATP-binding cassette subfamily B protein